MMVLNKRRIAEDINDFNAGGIPIEKVNEIKYLVIFLYQNVYFEKYFD